MRFSTKVLAVLLTLAAIPTVAQAGLATGYEMQTYPVVPEGQFTAYDGQLHYWTASGGYNIYNVASGATTAIGLPPNGTNTNGYGDAFGVLDPVNNLFYAATVYNWSDSDVYVYDRNAGSWQTPGKNGVTMANCYGGQVHNGQLYVAGLAQPWNGGYGQDNYIFAFDHSATPGGAAPRHDTLIQTTGNSANLAVAPNGDVYYGTFSDNTLYRWTAAQVAGVTDDLYAQDAVDHFLMLDDAQAVLTLPGAGNGVAVDTGGNVFFAVNGTDASYNFTHVLAMLDSSSPSGYKELYTTDGYMDWFGPISVDGDFRNGGTLYLSPSTFGGSGILGITAVPEPGAFVLLASAASVALFARRWRRTNQHSVLN